jgi:hypothetical protein
MHFVFLRSVHRLLVTANVVPSSSIIVTLIMEVLSSSETSVLTRATGRIIPEDGILHSHRRENLKSYNPSNISDLWSRMVVQLQCNEFEIMCEKVSHPTTVL